MVPLDTTFPYVWEKGLKEKSADTVDVCEPETSQWLSVELCSVQHCALSFSLYPMPLVFNLMLHVRWAHTIRDSYLRPRVLIQSPVKGPDQCGPPFPLPGFILSPVPCRELIIVTLSMHCWTWGAAESSLVYSIIVPVLWQCTVQCAFLYMSCVFLKCLCQRLAHVWCEFGACLTIYLTHQCNV